MFHVLLCHARRVLEFYALRSQRSVPTEQALQTLGTDQQTQNPGQFLNNPFPVNSNLLRARPFHKSKIPIYCTQRRKK